MEFALAKWRAGQELPLAIDSLLDPRGFDFAARRDAIPEDARNARAQEAAIDAVEAATRLDFKQALSQERAIFDGLVDSPESIGLRRHFFEGRAAARAGE